MNCTTENSTPVTMTVDGTLTTYGCAPTFTIAGTGTWNNFGDKYDNSSSGLTSSDTQNAIDELNTKIQDLQENYFKNTNFWEFLQYKLFK